MAVLDTTAPDFDGLVAFARSKRGELRPGLSWSAYASFLVANRATMLPALESLAISPWVTGCPSNPPPMSDDYESWSEEYRRSMNVDAICVLKRMQQEGRQHAMPDERAYLRAFTGWSGIDVWKLPADPNLFPEDYLTAIRKARKSKAGVTVFTAKRPLLDTWVAEGMLGVGARVAPSGVPRHDALVLGSAGRFLQTNMLAEEVTAVESDKLAAEILAAAYPDATVVARAPERFFASHDAPAYDFIALDAPPFGYKRAEKAIETDPGDGDEPITSSAAYLLKRAADVLRPGGVLVAAVPLEIVTNLEFEWLRDRLVAQTHFAGAVFPPDQGEQRAILVLVGLVEKSRQSEVDRVFARGEYVDSAEGLDNTMGVWTAGPDGRTVVEGEWSTATLVDGSMQGLPYSEVASISAWRGQQGAQVARRRREGAERARPQAQTQAVLTPERAVMQALDEITGAEPSVTAFATVLSARIESYMSHLSRGDEDRAKAEAGRYELLTDIQHFVSRFGDPHAISEVSGAPYTQALRAAVRSDGSLIPALTSPQSNRVFGAPAADASPVDIVAFYSRRFGVCTEADLRRHVEASRVGEIVDMVLGLDDFAVEYAPIRLYRMEDYLSGDLYGRIDQIDEVFDTMPERKEKLTAQRYRLLAAIDEQSIGQMYPTPRSGFIPLACLQDFINDRLKEKQSGNTPNVQLAVESGRLKVRTNGTLVLPDTKKVSEVQKAELIWLLGYWNRKTMVVDPDEVETSKNRVFAGGSKLRERLAKERDYERDFENWLSANDQWRTEVETIYNRSFRGLLPRKPDDSPLDVLRLGMDRPPHPHQNGGARRFTEQRGGLLAWAVGLGKTSGGTLTLANQRQLGICRKPIVVVPNNVLFNWLREVRAILPDYRVGMIGWSWTGTTAVQDTSDARRKKWERYAAGDYDVLLVPYSNFWLDVDIADQTVYDLMKDVFLFERVTSADEEDRALARRKLLELQRDLKALREAGDAPEKKIEDAEKGIASQEAKLRAPVRGILAALARALNGEPAPDDVSRPLRPRIGKSEDDEIDEEWDEGWTKPALMAFARARGIAIQDSTGYVVVDPSYMANPDRVEQGVFQLATQVQQSGQPVLIKPIGEDGVPKRGGKGKSIAKSAVVRILHVLFPLPPPVPSDAPSPPRPGIVTWERLGCDGIVIDEVQNYKNTWFAEPRLGSESEGGKKDPTRAKKAKNKIEFMGAVKPNGEKSKLDGARAWDVWTKCRYLQQQQKGVLLLTATPIKNSPLEIYNLMQLLSDTIWTRRKLTSSEEFIDRYIEFAVEDIPGIDFVPQPTLTVKRFDKNVGELRQALFYNVDRLTTEDLIAHWDSIGYTRGRIPTPDYKRVFVDMDQYQNFIYDQLSNLMEGAADEEEQGFSASLVRALALDVGEKAAVDPRLLAENVVDLRERLAADDDLQLEWKAYYDRGQRGKPPDRPSLRTRDRDFLEQKLIFLTETLGAESLVTSYGTTILPKYKAVAEYIRDNGGCGHVIFSDYNNTHEYMADALVRIAGIPRERIAILQGDVKSDERQEIADGFNGKWSADGELLVAPIYDVVLGNSGVMAEGVNLQMRTCAIHHLTYTWEPATITQRNGRGVRQGNTLSRVEVRYYISGNNPLCFPEDWQPDPLDPDAPHPNPSYDFFKLQKTIGKGDWQETLFRSDVRSSGNPFAGEAGTCDLPSDASGTTAEPERKLTLADIQYMLIARKDPIKAAMIRTLRQAEAAQQRKVETIETVERRFRDIVGLYAAARRAAPNSTQREVQLARAARDTEDLRRLIESYLSLFSPSIFDALDAAKERLVYLDVATGLYLSEGERVCLRSSDPSSGRLFSVPKRLEVALLDLKNNKFSVRDFGSMFRRDIDNPKKLLDDTLESQHIERLDLDACGGWDQVQDDQEVLAAVEKVATIQNLPQMAPNVATRLLDDIWDRLVDHADRTGRPEILVHLPYGFTPLVKKNDPEDIALLSYGAAKQIGKYKSRMADRLLEYRPLLPANIDPVTRFKLVTALKLDKVQVIAPSTSSPTGVDLTRVDEARYIHGAYLASLASTWLFSRGRGGMMEISPKVYEAMHRARGLRAQGKLVPETDEALHVRAILERLPVYPAEDDEQYEEWCEWCGAGGRIVRPF